MKNRFFLGFKKGFNMFSELIINIINYVLLSIVYLFGIGIVAIFSKVFRKDFIDTKWKKQKTYWIDEKMTKTELDDFYRQF